MIASRECVWVWASYRDPRARLPLQSCAQVPQAIDARRFPSVVAWLPPRAPRPLDLTDQPKRLGRGFFGGADVVQISCGDAHSACVSSSGCLFTWGLTGRDHCNQYGSLSPTNLAHAPEWVSGFAKVSAVSCGKGFTLALTQPGGRLWAWGEGDFGQLGLGDTEPRERPSVVSAAVSSSQENCSVEFVGISCGSAHCLAITKCACVFSWGDGGAGRLGHGDTARKLAPTKIEFFGVDQPVTAAAAGGMHSAVIASQGSLYVFGAGGSGQLGLGDRTHRETPTLVAAGLFGHWLSPGDIVDTGGARLKEAACGVTHTAALTQAGRCYLWGAGVYLVPRLVPPDVIGGSRLSLVACGPRNAMLASRGGALWEWRVPVSEATGCDQQEEEGQRARWSDPSVSRVWLTPGTD